MNRPQEPEDKNIRAIKLLPPKAIVRARDSRGLTISKTIPLDGYNQLEGFVDQYLFKIPKREKPQTILINATSVQRISSRGLEPGKAQSIRIYLPNEKHKSKTFQKKHQQTIPVNIDSQKQYKDCRFTEHEVSKEQQSIIKSRTLDNCRPDLVNFTMYIHQLNYTMDENDFIGLQKTINKLQGNEIIYRENLSNTESETIGELYRHDLDIIWTGDFLDGFDWRAKRKLKKESKETSALEHFQQFTKLLTNETIDNYRIKYGQ